MHAVLLDIDGENTECIFFRGAAAGSGRREPVNLR
jgi:hypothetical protein